MEFFTCYNTQMEMSHDTDCNFRLGRKNVRFTDLVVREGIGLEKTYASEATVKCLTNECPLQEGVEIDLGERISAECLGQLFYVLRATARQEESPISDQLEKVKQKNCIGQNKMTQPQLPTLQ